MKNQKLSKCYLLLLLLVLLRISVAHTKAFNNGSRIEKFLKNQQTEHREVTNFSVWDVLACFEKCVDQTDDFAEFFKCLNTCIKEVKDEDKEVPAGAGTGNNSTATEETDSVNGAGAGSGTDGAE